MSVRLVFPPKPVRADVAANVASSRGLPLFQPEPGVSGPVAICAAGPSLLDKLDLLRALDKIGVPICAVKGVVNVLADHGIKANYAVFLDPKEDQLRFFDRIVDGVQYLMGSQMSPKAFEKLQGHDFRVFHAVSPSVLRPGDHVVTGGATTGLRAINLMRWAGYNKLHLFGFDCAILGAKSHVYEPPEHGRSFKARVGDRSFVTTPELYLQHNQFIEQCVLAKPPANVVIYGNGTLAEAGRMIASNRANEAWITVLDDEIPGRHKILEPDEVDDFLDDFNAELAKRLASCST